MFKGKIQYNILKMYEGVFRKKHLNNVHTIVIPTSNYESLFMTIIGEIIKEPNSYACALIVRNNTEIINNIIENEKKHFGKRFFTLEDPNVIGQDLGQGKYTYKIPTKNYYLKSPLNLSFEPEYSSTNRRIYVLRGNINLEVKDVNSKHIGMMALKKLSLFKNRLFRGK